MKPSCGTCKHWLPRETPRWAINMGMAVCALKLTKAVTIAHWKACRKHEALPDDMAGARLQWLKDRQHFKTNINSSETEA